MNQDHYYPQSKISLRNRAFDNSYMKFLEKLQTQYYNHLYKNKRYSDITDDAVVLELFAKLHDFNSQGDKSGYFLITLNPLLDPNSTCEDAWEMLLGVIRRISDYKGVVGNNGVYCLEQRSNDFYAPRGMHAHILVQVGTESKSGVRKRVWNSVKRSFPGSTLESQKVTFSEINAMQYINGFKKTPDKMEKVAVDRQLREALGFTDVYDIGDGLHLLSPSNPV